MSDARRACLARLHEMDAALLRMEGVLPDDVRAFGAEVRQRVAIWLDRMAAGGVELEQFSEAMREISGMMDALTARLLLAPWDGPAPTDFKS